jgi:bacteriocin biosynthesis cyclodehydratase domain-containing protein
MNRNNVLMLIGGVVGQRCATLLEQAPGLDVRVQGLDASLAELLSNPDDRQIVVLVTERPCPAIATSLDELCWSAKIPWLHAELCGHQFRVGPAVIPPTTPCWECLRRRLRSLAVDLPAYLAIEAAGESKPSEPWFAGQLGALTEQVAALTAALCLSVCSGRHVPLADGMGHYWEGDAIFGVLRQRRFARVGRCPRCVPHDANNSYRWVAEHFGRRFVAKVN